MVKRSHYKITHKCFIDKKYADNFMVFKIKQQINNLRKENKEIKEVLYSIEKFLIMKESKNYYSNLKANHLLYLIKNSLKTP